MLKIDHEIHDNASHEKVTIIIMISYFRSDVKQKHIYRICETQRKAYNILIAKY